MMAVPLVKDASVWCLLVSCRHYNVLLLCGSGYKSRREVEVFSMFVSLVLALIRKVRFTLIWFAA